MRYLFTNEEIEAIEAIRYSEGIEAGFALGFGVALACAAVWALVTGVAS